MSEIRIFDANVCLYEITRQDLNLILRRSKYDRFCDTNERLLVAHFDIVGAVAAGTPASGIPSR